MGRKVSDSFGEMEVDDQYYYGAQTQRSLMNFPIGQTVMPKRLIEAFLMLKRSAAKANIEANQIAKEKGTQIIKACDRLLHNYQPEQFPLSVYQTGSGTQTNMNVNEVLAYIGSTDEVSLHPNDDVNQSQSSNDTFPTAMHIAVVLAVTEELIPAMERLRQTAIEKEKAFHEVIKLGRTHLQDATPITVGQEISAFRYMIDKGIEQLERQLADCFQLAIGGTAVGTGLNAPEGFGGRVAYFLSRYTGLPFTEGENHFFDLTSHSPLVRLHGTIKSFALDCFKWINDLRFLSSGPRGGYGEYTLPANEPGSSIMPGKVNPTQIEALTMVISQIIGNDQTISFAASQGHFQLNVYKPVIVNNVLESIELLSDGINSFNLRAFSGLEVNAEVMKNYVDQSLMLVTALSPHIGYDRASEIAKHAHNKGMDLKSAAIELGYVTADAFDEYVKVEDMI